MKKFCFILFMLFLSLSFSVSKSKLETIIDGSHSFQHNYPYVDKPIYDTLVVELKVKNENLFKVLDSIVTREPSCIYYSDSLYFNLMFSPLENDYWFLAINPDDCQTSISFLQHWGYFYYRNHLFIVQGREFCEDLFLKTGKKKLFPFKPFNVYIDDSFSQWLYLYKDGEFHLEQFVGCDD